MSFNFTILHFENYDIIDTKTKSHITPDNVFILDYMEVEKELYYMKRKRKRKRK